jgi:hypothetical protein
MLSDDNAYGNPYIWIASEPDVPEGRGTIRVVLNENDPIVSESQRWLRSRIHDHRVADHESRCG